MLHLLDNHPYQCYLLETVVSYLHPLEQFVGNLVQPSLLLALQQVYHLRLWQQQLHLFHLVLLCPQEFYTQMLFRLGIVLDQYS